MKTTLAILLVLVAAPAFAGDVSKSTLASLGLGELKVMSDAEGMKVRGLSLNAQAFGASLASAVIVDNANPGSFSITTDTNGSRSSLEDAATPAGAGQSATQGPQGSAVANMLGAQTATLSAGNAANILGGISAAALTP